MKFELLHPADQIVLIMERIYGYGMTTTSGGNLSILDDNGDIWITPGGIDKGSLTRKDIMKVTKDGKIEGPHRPSVEYPFHKSVYEKRPDIKAVLHAHPPATVAFSINRKIPSTNIIPNAHLICGRVGLAKYEIPGSKELGDNIADEFIKGFDSVVLENHGIVVVGEDLFQAFMRFETLDFCARLEIKSRRIGTPSVLSARQLNSVSKKQNLINKEFVANNYSSFERESRKSMCDLIYRSYKQRLFTSTQGTFSQRLSNDSFIITPYGEDRNYLEVEDLVRIEKGKKEKGKIPSRSAFLHEMIYKKNPDINAIMIAHPPHIMAYGITRNTFDTRTIPESYIMLREINRVPFGTPFENPEKIVELIDESHPVLMVENDSVIVVGNSLLNAFDRLEVLEYSAKALLSASTIGDLVPISDEEIEELKIAFKLK